MSSRSKRLPTLVSLASTCSPSSGPIGAIMMPPLDSWSTKARGRLSKAAQTTMRSNGPSPASPLRAVGLAHEDIGDAERLEALPRLLGQRLVAVDGDDAAASRAMTAAVKPEPVPISSTRWPGSMPSAAITAACRSAPSIASPHSIGTMRSDQATDCHWPGTKPRRGVASKAAIRLFGDDALAAQAQQEGGKAFAVVGHRVHASAFASWSVTS